MAETVGTKTEQKTSAGKDVYKTPEGESVSEKSVTIKFGDNAYVNAPSIYKGKKYTEDEVKKMLLEGIIKPTSRHDTLEEAIKSAETRSDNLLKDGGMAKRMAKQMELFEPVERGFDEGGLMDEGGTVDPVSGNDVPPGSTQEEVRDDIPAQLSEGEFVFPADVVRYIGLENLMRMRQEAKQGLAQMEAMGQMGNSEEATVEDNLPFDMYDLDVEDDGERNFNVGGYVAPTVPTNPYSQPGQVNPQTGTYTLPGTGIAGYQVPTGGQTGYTPYGGAAPYFQPVQFAGPQFQTALQTTNLPTFAETVGNKPGQYDELKTYVNDAGQTLQIPFKDGQPIYPIPEGYRPKGDEPVAEQPTTTTIPVSTSTTNQGDGGGAGDEGIQTSALVTLGGQSGTGRQKGLRVGDYKTFGVSYDVPGGLPGVAGALSSVAGLAFGKGLPAGATANIFDRDFPNASVTVSAADFNAMKAAGYKGELADMYKGALSTTADVLNNKAVNIAAPVGTKTGRMLDANGNPIGDKAQGIVEKAVVGSVLSNVKTSVPGFLGTINNIGKVSFEEAVANANDAQKAVLDNMGVDYDTSLDVTAAEKADMAKQEEKAMADAIAAANKAKADKARADDEAASREAANREQAARQQAARDALAEKEERGDFGGDNNVGESDGGGYGSDAGTGGGGDMGVICLTEDMKVKRNGVIDFVTKVQVGDIVDNTVVTEVLHKHMREGYYVVNGELKITNDHPVLANGSWKRTEDLVLGDYINNVEVMSLEYVEQVTPTVYIGTADDRYDVYTEGEVYTVHGQYKNGLKKAA